jgi:hypothetical protein
MLRTSIRANAKHMCHHVHDINVWHMVTRRSPWWVDDGIVFPYEPFLQAWDRERMKHPRYLFQRDQWLGVGQAIGEALVSRMNQRIYALTVQSWHVHGVIGTTRTHIAEIIKCAKDAVRWYLRIDRPIWAIDYDKRFCFDWPVVKSRIEYVEKHNLRNKWSARPWGFVKIPEEIHGLRSKDNPACVHVGLNGVFEKHGVD